MSRRERVAWAVAAAVALVAFSVFQVCVEVGSGLVVNYRGRILGRSVLAAAAVVMLVGARLAWSSSLRSAHTGRRLLLALLMPVLLFLTAIDLLMILMSFQY